MSDNLCEGWILKRRPSCIIRFGVIDGYWVAEQDLFPTVGFRTTTSVL